MAKKNPKTPAASGPPKGKSFTFRPEPDLWRALDAYLASLPHETPKQGVVADALSAFLTAKGFPPKSPPSS